MANGHEAKEYGPHKYEYDGTSNCKYGCGCWTGSYNSGGPIGLDPFGECPNNPEDGVRRSGTTDYHDVVNQRIRNLEQRAHHAEEKLKRASPSKKKLTEELATAKQRLGELQHTLSLIRDFAANS